MKNAALLLFFSFLLIVIPLTGMVATAKPVLPYLYFPPFTKAVAHAPFSWIWFTFLLLGATLVLVSVSLMLRERLGNKKETVIKKPGSFPWWGRVALVVLCIAWCLAWTRFTWFQPFQRYTFTPLWFSYIVVVNAICYHQTGSCPLLKSPRFFLVLFPVSALFWWNFEYLNQFARNWYYIGVDENPLVYTLHASISFSTVLPAVYSTYVLIYRSALCEHRLHYRPLPLVLSRSFSWLICLISILALAFIGLFPEELFPLIWMAPLFLLHGMAGVFGQPSFFKCLDLGDWRPLFAASSATLVCGFLWEMWNFYSQAKWIYSIPYVHGFHIFEMPLLGYLGYIPFGVMCLMVIDLIAAMMMEGDVRLGIH